MFEHGHHEDETLEHGELYNLRHFNPLRGSPFGNPAKRFCGVRRRPRTDHTNRIENDHPRRPSLRPFFEDRISLLSDMQAPDKTLFSNRLIRCEQPRQQIQTIHILLEDSTEVSPCHIGRGLLLSKLSCCEHVVLPPPS